MARDDPPAFYNARPTVRIGTMEYPMLSSQISMMEMREGLGGMSRLELRIADWITAADGSSGYGATGDDQPFKLGEEIAVYAGPSGAPQEIFNGLITGLESSASTREGPQITVLAEDLLFTMRRTRRSRIFEDMSVKQLVDEIAGEYSLTPQVRDGLDEPARTWAQTAETDLAFLRRALSYLDADLQLVGTDLQAGPIADAERSSVELHFPDTLLSARVLADMAHQYGEAHVAGLDIEGGTLVESTQTEGQLGPGEGGTGKEVLEDKFQAYPNHIRSHKPIDQSWADAMAKAAFGRDARRFLTARGTAKGNAEIRVGSWLVITGLNPMFANQFNAIEVNHRFDLECGYQTDFVAQCAYFGGAA